MDAEGGISTVGAKRSPILIEKRDLRVFLASRMAGVGGSQAALAELLGVNPSTVYDLLSGAQEPSDEILKRAGLRPVYVVEEQVPEPPEPPAKLAKGKK